ncbi:MAG: glycosyltransferase [Gemmatimonadota bacterium]
MTSIDSAPILTAVLLVPDEFATIAKTVEHISSQSRALETELLIVAMEPSTIWVPEGVSRSLHSVRVIQGAWGGGSGSARAAAVRAAAASIIVFAEDHCFPQQGWAEALISCHETSSAAAVGPEVHNANPTNRVSWSDLLMGYGPWIAPQKSGPREHLPGHNTSYRRAALLALGDDLPSLMEAETVLQWRLRSAGHQLHLEANARVSHTNFDAMNTWLRVSFHAGRVFAATRVVSWPAVRRLVFFAASPLIPFVRLARHLKQARGAGWSRGRIFALAPTLLLGLVADGLGQALGLLLGPGASPATLVEWEFHRNERRVRARG